MSFKKLMVVSLCSLMLAGCTTQAQFENKMAEEAHVTDRTRAGTILAALPAPSQKVAVAVYDFQDMTGQFKENGKYTDYSSAVTKGGHAILVKALLDSGNRRWFTVVERGSLKNLLQERQIIKVERGEYTGPDGKKLPNLPPMIYGGVMLEGGIVSYDSNVITGGAGATFLGVGATTQYQRDLVTVYLRAVNIQSGEVLLSVTSSKTLYSVSLDANLLKYFTYDKLFQAETGFSLNEPTQLAVRQAIETAVYSMIMEGAVNKIWGFRNAAEGKRAISEYLNRRDGKRGT
jgi:curli production assembly/transport component CsgG